MPGACWESLSVRLWRLSERLCRLEGRDDRHSCCGEHPGDQSGESLQIHGRCPQWVLQYADLADRHFFFYFQSVYQHRSGGASVAILVLLYVFIHYFFASNTAHISALFASFFGVGVALGAPPLMFGLFLGFSSSLCASLTHYGTGSVPVLFGSGYVSMGEWWKWGFVVTVVNLLVFSLGCAAWWKLLGYW